jgi:hypothetical protein
LKKQAIWLCFSLWLQDQDPNDREKWTRPKDADLKKQGFYLLG